MTSDNRVDDYIVDAAIDRLGADHYSGNESTPAWRLLRLEVGRNVFSVSGYPSAPRPGGYSARELGSMYVVQFRMDEPPSALLCQHASCFPDTSAPPVPVHFPGEGDVSLVECRLYPGNSILESLHPAGYQHPVQDLVVDEELDDPEKILDEIIETDARLDLAAIIRRGIKQGIISNTPLYQ